MLVAAAATAFFSCQKQEIIAPETEQEVMLTFASEKPAFDDETKTEWTGETIQWSKGDKISVAYTVGGNWQNASGDATGNAKLYKSDALTEASLSAKFNVSTSFTGATSGVHVFYGVYPAPSSTDFPESPVANLTVAPSQTPKADSFDPNGDLMIGVSNEYGSRPGEDETISLKWERLVAHAVISLKNINGLTADEKIENITLTAQDDANLVGQQKVNLITKEVVKDNAAANVLKLGASNLTVNEGVLSFWACVLPETITSLTVVVETDKATYTREITGISKTFKQNARNTLAIKMDEAVREEKVVASDEVVDVLNRALTEVEGTSYASWNGKTSISDAVYAGQSAGGNESIQLRSNNSNSGIVTTTSGGFAKKVTVIWNSNTSNGRTLNVYGSNTAYTDPTELYDNTTSGTKLGTIVCGTSTELVIDGDYEYIGLRSNSGAMYISEIQITWSTGPVTPDTTPSITVEETLELTYAESEGTINVTYKNLEALEAAAYSDAECTADCDWLIASWENDAVSYLAAANEGDERTAYIQIYALDAEANVFTKVITVTQEGKPTVDTTLDGDYWIYEPNAQKVMAPIGETETSARPGNGIATVTDGNVATFAVNNFKFAYDADMQAYTIKDSYGRYLYSGYYNGNVSAFMYASATLPEGSSGYWSATRNSDGTYVLLNKDTNYELAYDASYSNWSLYASGHNKAYPTLVKADNPLLVELASIAVLGQTSSYVINDTFEFDGVVTATYNDGTTKTVAPTSVSSPDMTKAGNPEVTVTYIEGAITKTTTYTIFVVDPNAGDDLGIPSATACYTLDTTNSANTGSNNSYTGNCDVTCNGIIWNVTGNATMNPWRVGGKSLTNVDRNVYTKTAYPTALSKIEFVSGTMNVSSWNSLKLQYSINSDFSDAVTITASSVGASQTISFAPEGGFPANCYFRFVLNVTVSGSSNKYIQVNQIKFYGYEN